MTAIDHESGVTALDHLDPPAATAALLACCDAPAWAARMLLRRPFGTLAALLEAAEQELAASDENDIDTALAAHPRIGERPSGESSRSEQARALAADPSVLMELAAGNADYEARFGHVYLVCASGRSAEELLDVLRSRLDNDPVTERRVLRRELAGITRLRLTRTAQEYGEAHQ